MFFQVPEYIEPLGLQLLLWRYYEKVGHPCLAAMEKNFFSWVGEDIELCNGSLGQVVFSKKGQSDPEDLSTPYRRLGMMLRANSTIRKEILNVRSLKGWEGNKRLRYNEASASVLKAQVWVKELIDTFRDGTFTHYEVPETLEPFIDETLASHGKRKKVKSFSAHPTASRDVEATKVELMEVAYILDYNWEAAIKVSMDSVLARKWKFTLGDTDVRDLPSYSLLEDFLYT